MWWIWVGHTVFGNHFDSDARSHRVATLLLMFLIILASVFIGGGLEKNHAPFVLAYGLARLFIAGFYLAAPQRHPGSRSFARRTGLTFVIGAAISSSAALLPLGIAVFVLYAGIVFDIVGRKFIVTQSIPVDRDHLVERVGRHGE